VQLPLVTLAAIGVVLVLLAVVRGRFLRGRLGFSGVLLLCALGLDVALRQGVGDPLLVGGLAQLLLVAAVLVSVVSLAFNPWRQERASERVPAIVQDVIVIALFAVAATLLLDEKVLTTSAVGAVVVGFALQDTLGNLFAGLAIQVEKPFRVGHWIRVGDYEGKVQEVTWRATKLLTRDGQFAVVPNSVMSRDPILNYSEPTVPTLVEVEIGTNYETPPNTVKQALYEAVASAPLTLKAPAPEIIFEKFADSSLIFRVRFWIADFAQDYEARDQVRSNIWYTLRRRGIEIPFPIQVEMQREETEPRPPAYFDALADRLAGIDCFSSLDSGERAQLARTCRECLFGAGEPVVRQGDEGRSMFVVLEGRVRVTLEPSGQEVAVISRGGFLGEMSMLTGQPRTATVSALDDALLLEITADRFRDLAVARPGLVDEISDVVSRRRTGLEEVKAAAEGAHAGVPARVSLLKRIQQFLQL
jgi:small-conductance mechanosensitive channel/CRP-like cAMP-binding protein